MILITFSVIYEDYLPKYNRRVVKVAKTQNANFVETGFIM
jgi:hypothetical protein